MFPADAGCPKIRQNVSDRNLARARLDNDRPLHARFCQDKVVALLALNRKALELKHLDQLAVG